MHRQDSVLIRFRTKFCVQSRPLQNLVCFGAVFRKLSTVECHKSYHNDTFGTKVSETVKSIVFL